METDRARMLLRDYASKKSQLEKVEKDLQFEILVLLNDEIALKDPLILDYIRLMTEGDADLFDIARFFVSDLHLIKTNKRIEPIVTKGLISEDRIIFRSISKNQDKIFKLTIELKDNIVKSIKSTVVNCIKNDLFPLQRSRLVI